MAPDSGHGPAEDDLEGGGSQTRDTSYSTRAIRDITYKIIPFCGFCLVVFSIGATLTSTLAFDKPTPHQATLVIAFMLLSFFVLFCIGFMYLFFRKFHPHTTKHASPTASIRGEIQYKCRPWKSVWRVARGIAGLFSHAASSNGKNNHAASRDVVDTPARTDTLRDPAPSPNTVRRAARLAAEGTQMRRACTERAGEHKHPIDELSRRRTPNTARQRHQGVERLPNAREPDVFLLASVASTPCPRNPNSLVARECSVGSLPAGEATQYLYAAGNRHNTVSHSPVAGSWKMSAYAQRETLQSISKRYVHTDSPLIPDQTADRPSAPSQLRREKAQPALPVEANLAGEDQSVYSKQQPLYGGYEINVTEDVKKLQVIGWREDQKQRQVVEPSPSPMTTRNEQGSSKAARLIRGNTHLPSSGIQADTEKSHQKALDKTDSSNATNPSFGIPFPASPGSPIHGRPQGFNPQYFPAAPAPLHLVPKDHPKYADRATRNRAFATYHSYVPLSCKLETKPPIPVPQRCTGQRSPSTSYRPPMYEDEVQVNEGEAPKKQVQTQDQERIKGPRGGGQGATVQPRASSRGFGTRTPNASRGLYAVLSKTK